MVLKIRVYATFVNLKIAKDAVVFRNNTFYTCKAFWVTFMYISLFVFIYLSFDFHLFILTFIHTISSHFNVFFIYHVLFGSKLPFKQKPHRVDASPAAKEWPGVLGERGMVVTSYRFLNLSVMFFGLGGVLFSCFPVFNPVLGEIFTLMLTNLFQVGWNHQLVIYI